jgi:nucleoside-diphosphate-sugar epimerase
LKLQYERIAILGATGPTGKLLAREWSQRGVSVRVVSRSSANLARAFSGVPVEAFPADVLSAEATCRAVDGCDLVYDCIGLPLERMADHPASARNVAEAATRAAARIVHVSSYWSYMPIVRLPVDEGHPREGGSEPARFRREAEDILLASGAAVLNLPDFYGPEVHTSILNRALEEAASGKTVNWMGSRRTAREHVYLPDAMEVAAAIAVLEGSYGERWVVPGSGPIDLDGFVAIVEKHLGRSVSARVAGRRLLVLLSLFSKELGAFRPLLPTYTSPVRYDGAKLDRLMGERTITPYGSGIPATLDWLRAS